ncbi:MAG TPA: geranylgeranylglyceryl/heptaprenylglyceryl phosphate synthase [Methanosarcinales archaeon]|nr:geranylgeranylglyceryl/heptaprenylglyceryl phosphate synthase [Methanosarcinales archaeon]
MRIEQHLENIIKKDGAAHLTLIDPDAQDPMVASDIAEAAEKSGSSAIMIGGSIGASGGILDETLRAIRTATDLPTILFPSGACGLSRYADAVFFMSLLNSRDPNYLIINQMLGAKAVLEYGIEPIPMAYIIVEPGGMAGWIGDARLIPRKKPKLAVAYALAGKFLGMRYTYLEAGSGASEPVPPEMINAVKSADCGTLVVGGGIRDAEAAKVAVKAGADIIVTGTAIEEATDIQTIITEFVDAIKR